MKTRTSKFILFLVVLAMLVPTLFCTASAADAMPTTETEGIVDGGLYQILGDCGGWVERVRLMYLANFQWVCSDSYENNAAATSGKDQSYKFRITYMGDGTYTISPMSWRTARLQADGNELTVAPPNDSPEQRWYIIPCEGGYEIRSAANEHWALCCVNVYDVSLSGSDDHSTWSFEPVSEMEDSGNYIHVMAPVHWRPALDVYDFSENAVWCGPVVMDPDGGGWYSFPSPNVDDIIGVKNYFHREGQLTQPPDMMEYTKIEPGKDYWIVVHDDPNVDGDLKLTVYDSKPENLPETADPAALAPAAAALIVSTLALLMSVKLKPKE